MFKLSQWLWFQVKQSIIFQLESVTECTFISYQKRCILTRAGVATNKHNQGYFMIIKHFEEFARNKNMAVPEVVGLPPSRTVHMERINVKSLRSECKHCIGYTQCFFFGF